MNINVHLWYPCHFPWYGVPIWSLWPNTRFLPSIVCWKKCAYMFNVYKNQLSRQTGSRNMTGPKTLSTIWGTYMKLVTKYQISAINSCWEKCDKKCAYMFNVYKNQLRRQTGSRNQTDPETLPTIYHTYMKLVTKYQISAINSWWEKCDKKMLRKMRRKNIGRTDRRTEVKQYTPSPFWERGIIRSTQLLPIFYLFSWWLV